MKSSLYVPNLTYMDHIKGCTPTYIIYHCTYHLFFFLSFFGCYVTNACAWNYEKRLRSTVICYPNCCMVECHSERLLMKSSCLDRCLDSLNMFGHVGSSKISLNCLQGTNHVEESQSQIILLRNKQKKTN